MKCGQYLNDIDKTRDFVRAICCRRRFVCEMHKMLKKNRNIRFSCYNSIMFFVEARYE